MVRPDGLGDHGRHASGRAGVRTGPGHRPVVEPRGLRQAVRDGRQVPTPERPPVALPAAVVPVQPLLHRLQLLQSVLHGREPRHALGAEGEGHRAAPSRIKTLCCKLYIYGFFFVYSSVVLLSAKLHVWRGCGVLVQWETMKEPVLAHRPRLVVGLDSTKATKAAFILLKVVDTLQDLSYLTRGPGWKNS